jgi:hypothetical protein
MSSTVIAPIENYNSASTSPTPDNYAQFGVQEQASVNLNGSSLWLVDNSLLNSQSITTLPVVLEDRTELVKYQTSVPIESSFGNVTPINLTSNTLSESDLLEPIVVPDVNLLRLPEISGSSQVGSLSASSADGSSMSGTTNLSGKQIRGSISGGSSSSDDAQSSIAVETQNSEAKTQNSEAKTQNSEAIAQSQSSISSDSPGQTASKVSTTQSSVQSLPKISKSVPFNITPTLGLVILFVLFSSKFLARYVADLLRFNQEVNL